jgi:tRNA A37 N6-isopentenylltransferase MiaA
MQAQNELVTRRLSEYDEVIVLTGRDVSDCTFTENQLRDFGIKVDKIICCPRKQLIDNWKLDTVKELEEEGPLDWVDDEHETTGSQTSQEIQKLVHRTRRELHSRELT